MICIYVIKSNMVVYGIVGIVINRRKGKQSKNGHRIEWV